MKSDQGGERVGGNESIGFANVTTVTSSGNLLVKQLEYLPGSAADRKPNTESHIH